MGLEFHIPILKNDSFKNLYHHSLFILDEKEWRAVESLTQDQGFLLKINEGDRNVTGGGIQNAEQPSAAKKFRVSGALQESGPWIILLEDEVKVVNIIQTFNFNWPLLIRYLKFDLITYARQRGGGLRFFTILFMAGRVTKALHPINLL